MARSLLINQLDKLIVDLEKEYHFYITYAEEINSKIAILRKTKSIAIEKLNKKFPQREYKRAFKHSLKMLLSQVLKENKDTFLSTVEITEKMLALDGQDTSLKLEDIYTATSFNVAIYEWNDNRFTFTFNRESQCTFCTFKVW